MFIGSRWRLDEARHNEVFGFSNLQHKEPMKNKTPSLLARIRQWYFNKFIQREIFNRIFPHLLGERNHGYEFRTDEEMDAQTEELDVPALLQKIEQQARNMPKSYGRAFRHVMHRDISERLQMYEQVARRRVKRTCDPRFVASHA